MKNVQIILDKIKSFQQKFYVNELIKGVILFLAIGLLFFLGTLFIESWLWLSSDNRWILFALFLGIELFLLATFIGWPLFKLIGISKGISMEDGAIFIGEYFPLVDDKLLNIIQLNAVSDQSDMLLASIEQRASELAPVPFLKAVRFASNVKYLKFLFPLFFVLGLIFLTNSISLFSNSLKRVVNPSMVYVKPAPFYFSIKNSSLTFFEQATFILQVETIGVVVPEDVEIVIDGNSFVMKQVALNLFEYSFLNPRNSIHFQLSANLVVSKEFELLCKKVPVLENLDVFLTYPSYTQLGAKKVSNVGQLIVPRGTTIKWQVAGKNVDTVFFTIDGIDLKKSFIELIDDTFVFQKTVASSFQYAIFSKNKNIEQFEPLNFEVLSLEDEFPRIAVHEYVEASIEGENRFLIDVSDDYLVSEVFLCFSVENEVNTLVRKSIFSPKSQFFNFSYNVSDQIDFIDGKRYECYFEVFDNDAVLGAKSSKSELFKFYKKTEEELREEHLKNEKRVITTLENERFKQLKIKDNIALFKNQLNSKKEFNFKDKSKFNAFIAQQKKHASILKRTQESLLKSVSDSKVPKSMEDKKRDLENRIRESLEMEKKNKLLAELQELANKLNKEDLVKKLQKMSTQNKQQERSLEKLVEMMKRFYVEEKAMQLIEDLKNLSKKQEALSYEEDTLSKQQELNKQFEAFKKELEDLRDDNIDLKKPMELMESEKEELAIQKEMEKAIDNISENKSPKKNQKNAATEMKEMAVKMEAKMKEGELEMVAEDMKALRAIVENLINFSFQQESLFVVMKGLQQDHSLFPENVKKQYQLKQYFEHIDDSLYVLSLRMEKMSSKIDKELIDAHYFLGNSLEYFSEVKFRDGIKSQQYVMVAVNNLAVMLSDLLENMMNAISMPAAGKGTGKGEGIGLPDIIKKQSELLGKMEKGLKPGRTGKPKPGEQGDEGEDALYKLFQEQTKIKELFDAMSKNKGGSKLGKEVSKKMEELLEAIIEHGVTDTNLKKMVSLRYELLKLKNALKDQGEKEARKSEENVLKFPSHKIDSVLLKKYFKTKDELLLRQSLPLHHDYKIKVTKYFKTN
ncbi:MAG: hypothetical protein JKY08_04535 [Flavobacteriaceae bacterium]|nr:hypothetical protein [Flavobacteriaceae bacterium]